MKTSLARSAARELHRRVAVPPVSPSRLQVDPASDSPFLRLRTSSPRSGPSFLLVPMSDMGQGEIAQRPVRRASGCYQSVGPGLYPVTGGDFR